MASTVRRQNCIALPYYAKTEREAEMFADVATVLFYDDDIKMAVFEDGGRWCVAVLEGAELISDPVNNETLFAAFMVVLNFEVIERRGGSINTIAQSLSDLPAEWRASTRRARRAMRIEEKLDAVLAAMKERRPWPVATGRDLVAMANAGERGA